MFLFLKVTDLSILGKFQDGHSRSSPSAIFPDVSGPRSCIPALGFPEQCCLGSGILDSLVTRFWETRSIKEDS